MSPSILCNSAISAKGTGFKFSATAFDPSAPIQQPATSPVGKYYRCSGKLPQSKGQQGHEMSSSIPTASSTKSKDEATKPGLKDRRPLPTLPRIFSVV
ncbi:Uncharacterized protein HZ326_28442 [Fusarium oxysporum f. sp. albedinis]|nr:Uncharacterized protein HZ326_28442 [Fusarium oxysporum f. sp. albedinis]